MPNFSKFSRGATTNRALAAQTDIQETEDYEKSLHGMHIYRSGNRF
jgi:hypothetical protein